MYFRPLSSPGLCLTMRVRILSQSAASVLLLFSWLQSLHWSRWLHQTKEKKKYTIIKKKLKKSRRKYFQSRTIFRWMERVFGCSRQSHGWLASFFYNFPATIVGALRNNGWFESIGTDSWERERWNRLFGDKFYWESRGIPSVHTHNYVNEKHVGCLRKEAIKYRRERDKVAGKHRHLVFGVFMEFILLIADVVTGATFMDHHDDRPATTVPWPALPDRKEPCVCVWLLLIAPIATTTVTTLV